MGGTRNAQKILRGESFGKQHLGRPRRKQQDNIMMDAEINCGSGRWMALA
jgi:hypothetical protein